MAAFKKGDRVRRTMGRHGGMATCKVGTVERVRNVHDWSVLDLVEYGNGHDSAAFELVEPEPDVVDVAPSAYVLLQVDGQVKVLQWLKWLRAYQPVAEVQSLADGRLLIGALVRDAGEVTF